MKSRKYVPGILVDGRGLRGPKGDKGDAGFVASEITSYITNLTDYAGLTHTHGNVIGVNITATSANSGLTLSVGNYLTTAAASDHTHTGYLTTAAGSTHTHGGIAFGTVTGTDMTYSSASNGLSLSLSVPVYLTTAAESWHSHNDLYIPLANSASYQLTANNSLSAYSTHIHGSVTALGNITVGSSSNGAVFSVSEGIKQILLAGNTVGTAGILSTGTVVLAAAGAITFSQNGNTVTIYGSGGTGGAVGVGYTTGSTNAGTDLAATLNSDGLSLVYPRFLTTAIGTVTAITGGSMTGNAAGLSINLPAYITTAMVSNAGSNFIGLATAVTNASLTADSRGISLNIPNYLTTARGSTDALGLATAATNVTWTADSRGISLDAIGYVGTGTAISGGLMTADSRGISIDVASAAGMGLATAITGGLMTGNTDGLSIDLSPAVGVGLGTTIATTSGAILKITANTDGLNISHPNWLTTAMLSNAGSNFVGLATAVTGGSMTANSNGISVNIPPTGVAIADNATNVVSAGTVQFINSNGVSFGYLGTGTASKFMTASWKSADYVLTAVSSLYQLTANNSLSAYSSHTHGSNVYTQRITDYDFKFTSSSNYLSMGIPWPMALLASGHTGGTVSLLDRGTVTLLGGNNITLNQVGSNLYIHGESGASAGTHTHGTVAITGGIGITSASSGLSVSIPAYLTTAANSTHTHTIGLYKTNINATSASNALSLSVPVGSVYFSNIATNNITFGSIASGSSTTITAIAGGGSGAGGGMGTGISTSGAITASGNTAGLSITVPALGHLYFGNIAHYSFVSTVAGVSTTIGLSTA